MSGPAERLLEAAQTLRSELSGLTFDAPVTHVYNTLEYAWEPYARYFRYYCREPKRVLFLGMNPGPWGMAQTGVPFGEIRAVREWMGINAPVGSPQKPHPKRPVHGFDCPRSEVSGTRLWGLMQDRYGTAEAFFADHFVLNYCPLLFFEEDGRNRTPDKLKKAERTSLFRACDTFLTRALDTLAPHYLVGVGRFATDRLAAAAEEDSTGASATGPRATGPRATDRGDTAPRATDGGSTGRDGADAGKAGDTQRPAPQIVQLPHPSPANPAANRDWAGAATRVLIEAGVWQG
jgi:single-strand selective monofunctional uracil DNA glycosylase